MSQDAIFALATAAGRAAVAVVRLSGPGTGEALTALAGKLPLPRRASVRALKGIDQALVLWFPAPASYTGEDCAELHLHGGSAVIERALTALADLGLRPAEPGEFTRRAFENGKLDLAQAEAVADLIDAQTAAQAEQALAQLGGVLSQRHEAWRAGLIEALAMLEANVDFPDEELPADLAHRAAPPLEALRADIADAVQHGDRGQAVREGYRIALIGAPNAGKSSLLNALAGRDAAIVTATPGTTRDVVEVPMELAGYRILLADTAGLRDTEDEIEAEGVRRARAWAEGAHLRLLVVDSSAVADGVADSLMRPGDLCILNKSDLPQRGGAAGIKLSLKPGDGLEILKAGLEQIVVAALSGHDFPAITQRRHAQLLAEADVHLARALGELARSPELAAEDVRLAARALGRVTGRIDPEDVLDQVFAKFCIGK
jgi:tRNA modification GTPase